MTTVTFFAFLVSLLWNVALGILGKLLIHNEELRAYLGITPVEPPGYIFKSEVFHVKSRIIEQLIRAAGYVISIIAILKAILEFLLMLKLIDLSD
jgi:hypothetical protein